MTANEAIEAIQSLQKQLQAIEPLQPADIETMTKQAHKTDPELQRLDAEIRQLKAIDAHLPGGNGSRDTEKKPEVLEEQRVQDAQEVRQLV